MQHTQPHRLKVSKPKAIRVRPELLAEIEQRVQTASGKVLHGKFAASRRDDRAVESRFSATFGIAWISIRFLPIAIQLDAV